MTDEILDFPSLCKKLNRCDEVVRGWIADGSLPRPSVRINRKSQFWLLSEVIEFLKSNRHLSVTTVNQAAVESQNPVVVEG